MVQTVASQQEEVRPLGEGPQAAVVVGPVGLPSSPAGLQVPALAFPGVEVGRAACEVAAAACAVALVAAFSVPFAEDLAERMMVQLVTCPVDVALTMAYFVPVACLAQGVVVRLVAFPVLVALRVACPAREGVALIVPYFVLVASLVAFLAQAVHRVAYLVIVADQKVPSLAVAQVAFLEVGQKVAFPVVAQVASHVPVACHASVVAEEGVGQGGVGPPLAVEAGEGHPWGVEAA